MVDLSQRDAGLMRALMYVVQFEQNPLDGVDRALERVVYAGTFDADPDEFRAAIARGLSSRAPLSALGAEYHPEVIVRRYLGELHRRLEVTN